MSSDTLTAEIRAACIRQLARRAYGRVELAQRLLAKGFPAESVECVLGELAREGLIDDRRFAAMLVRRRAEQGYGRARVVAELRQLGVASDAMPDADVDWDAVLLRLYRKRYGTREAVSDRDRTSRWRYLAQRGFSTAQIRRVLRANECPDAVSDFSTSCIDV